MDGDVLSLVLVELAIKYKEGELSGEQYIQAVKEIRGGDDKKEVNQPQVKPSPFKR